MNLRLRLPAVLIAMSAISVNPLPAFSQEQPPRTCFAYSSNDYNDGFRTKEDAITNNESAKVFTLTKGDIIEVLPSNSPKDRASFAKLALLQGRLILRRFDKLVPIEGRVGTVHVIKGAYNEVACPPISCKFYGCSSLESNLPTIESDKRTTILGTFPWDAETNRQGDAAGEGNHDIWWEIIDERQQFFTPWNGASVSLIKDRSYESVTLDYMRRLNYSGDKISSRVLRPGTILALRTNQGNFAKIMILGYRDLHDLSFPDAKWLRPVSRDHILSVPNRPNQNLDLRWRLYK